MNAWKGSVLIISGLFLALPQVYSWLSAFTGGQPYIQVIVGIFAITLGLWTIFGKQIR